MDIKTLNEYRAIRKRDPRLPAKIALSWAKRVEAPLELEWDTFGRGGVATATGERDGYDVSVTVDYDPYRQIDITFTDDNDTGIRNPKYHGPDGWNREKKFIELESGYTVAALAEDLRGRSGRSKNVAWEEARQSLQDEAAMYLGEDYIMVTVDVSVSVDGVVLGEASIGSDFQLWQPGSSFERELEDCVIENGLIAEAIDNAKENLDSITEKQRKRLAKLEALTV